MTELPAASSIFLAEGQGNLPKPILRPIGSQPNTKSRRFSFFALGFAAGAEATLPRAPGYLLVPPVTASVNCVLVKSTGPEANKALPFRVKYASQRAFWSKL